MMHLYVVIPCYNCEKYLSSAVQSVIEQSSDLLGITAVLVDDGSSDRTPQLCDRFAERYPGQVCVLHKKNGGVSTARNAGIEYVLEHFPEALPQSYFAFMDADDAWVGDFWDGDCLALLQRGYDLIGFQSCNCDSNLEKRAEIVSMQEGVFSGGEASLWLHSDQQFCSMLYSCRLIERHHIRFNTKITYSEDKIFRMTCLFYADQLALKNRLLYCYRLNIDSLVHRRPYGTAYYLPIIEAYLSMEKELNASAAEKGGARIGTVLAWHYLMKMVDEHFQCFRPKKQIDAVFDSHPDYVELLEGKNERHPQPNPVYLYMREKPLRYRLKNYRKGLGMLGKRILRRIPAFWRIAEKRRFRFDIRQ